MPPAILWLWFGRCLSNRSSITLHKESESGSAQKWEIHQSMASWMEQLNGTNVILKCYSQRFPWFSHQFPPKPRAPHGSLQVGPANPWIPWISPKDGELPQPKNGRLDSVQAANLKVANRSLHWTKPQLGGSQDVTSYPPRVINCH